MKKHKKTLNLSLLIYEHVTSNIKEYLLVSIVLCVGVILGVIAVNHLMQEQIDEINTYVADFIANLKNSPNIDNFVLLKNTLINNLGFIIAITIAGSTVIGIPIVYAMVLFKGFSFSYTISAIIAVLDKGKGITFVLASIGLQNLIYIPCIIATAVSGIKLYKAITQNKSKENIKVEIWRHLLFCIVIGGIVLVGSLVEVYISTNLLIWYAKYL